MRCLWIVAVVILAFALATEAAGTNDMVLFVKEYCDKRSYPGGATRGDIPKDFGGDCAHFVARAIQAGACLPGASATGSLWDYAAYRANGKTYKLICVGCNRCYAADGRTIMPGLNEYLRDAGWINRGTSYDAVDYGCAVIGNPYGPRGDCSHSAFGIGPRRIAAHTSDHCDIDVAQVFESLQAVWCAPPQCQSCQCTPCQDCVNGECVEKCGGCQVCDGQRCVAKCNTDNCEVCEGGNCRQTCSGCTGCQNGRCVDQSDSRCPDQCTRCENGQCVKTQAALNCEQNRCKRCVDGQCVNTRTADSCNACEMCDPDSGACVPNPAKTNCANKCQRCNPSSGACDVPSITAAGCTGCEFCDPADGQCKSDTAKFTNCYNTNKCSTCDPANGQCKLDPVKTTCKDKCKRCNSDTGNCDVPTQTATDCAENQCKFCDSADGQCKDDPVKGACADKCTRCNPADGTCNLPTATALSCNACQRCNSSTGQCEKNPDICASDKCFDCNPSDAGKCTLPRDANCAADKCFMCDAKTGSCDMPRNLTCVANKCYKCDPANGQCIFNSDIKCSACEVCDPISGKCIDAGNCDKCSVCTLDGTNADGYVCTPKENVCPKCQRCVKNSGECQDLRCGTCATCNISTDACQVTPNAACGTNAECQFCNSEGLCVARLNASCSLTDNDACRNPYCTADGECAMSTDFAAVGTRCGTPTDCTDYVCDVNGKCVERPVAANTTCSLAGINLDCQKAVCTGKGQCVAVELAAGTVCNTLPEDANNSTKTSCRNYTCQAGKCVPVALENGLNCTGNALEESPCSTSICQDGMCVLNGTIAGCIKLSRSKGKTGIVVGAAAGGVALLLLGVGIFVATRAAQGVPLGLSGDPMTTTAAINPTYVQMAENHSPLYEGK